MAFPSSPTNGQVATVGGITYTYNSTKTAWVRTPSTGANLSVFSTVITGSTPSTSTTSGALQVTGGAGVQGALHVGDNLHVTSGTASTSTSTGAIITDGGAGIAGNLWASTVSLTGGDGGAQLNLRNGGDFVLFNGDNSGQISVYCDTNGELLVNGNHRIATSLGVGTAPSGTTGEIRATNEITAYYSSDERLKENVVVIDNALGKLQQLRGVMFDWKQEIIDERGGEDGFFVRKHDTGIIAQEVEAVLPEVVATREDGYKAVKYEKLAGLIIQAINELAGEVAEIKRRIE